MVSYYLIRIINIVKQARSFINTVKPKQRDINAEGKHGSRPVPWNKGPTSADPRDLSELRLKVVIFIIIVLVDLVDILGLGGGGSRHLGFPLCNLPLLTAESSEQREQT